MVRLEAMQAAGPKPAGTVPSPRLVRAAHEFEGQLMQLLLKPMTDSDGLTGDEDSGSAGALGSFAAEALGQGLSERGGLGIATSIIHSLSHSEKPPHSGTVSTSGHASPASVVSKDSSDPQNGR